VLNEIASKDVHSSGLAAFYVRVSRLVFKKLNSCSKSLNIKITLLFGYFCSPKLCRKTSLTEVTTNTTIALTN